MLRNPVPTACGQTSSLWRPLAVLTLAVLPLAAAADDAKGKFVWFDERNSALLLECAEGGCPTIPSAKTGETYTFIVPAALRAAVQQLKEGQVVNLAYDDRKEAGYVLIALKP